MSMTTSHFVISQPKSMQQIAILIITFAVYVAGIRNGNSQQQMQPTNSNENDNIATEKYQSSDFFPSQPLSGMPETLNSAAARQSYSGFQPMQVFSFTAADVPNERPHYPPSYIEPNYHSSTKLQEYAAQKYARTETQKQFAFPAAAPPTKYQYNGLYEQSSSNKPSYYQNNYNNQQFTEPPPPILTYLDPYTNQDYQSATPQEYTVQSSLLVGQQHNKPAKYSSSYMRPGYVFDEQLHASTSSSNSIAHTQQREDVAAPPPTAGSKISYDSHDYPPPSYSQLQTSNFVQVPPSLLQEQPRPTAPPPPPPPPQPRPTPPSYSSDNYYAPHQQQQQHYYRPTPTYERPRPTVTPPPPPPPPAQHSPPPYRQEFIYRPLGSRPPQAVRPPPSYNNYYEYQLGEVPPQPRPPYRPPLQQQQQPATSGLASLASLFGQNSPQQYAPQFGSGPLGSLLGALAPGFGQQQPQQPQYGGQQQRPLNAQLIRALENIARNDDLQCVPKVLCQMIAGQTQRGQLPSFITSPALTNFLSIFPASSPALIYGRAALLGISGGESSCTQTYLQCPKNEYEILHYLNNHRGGFFKFFSEPEEQQAPQHSSQSAANGGGGSGGGGGASSFLSILAALTGNPVVAPTTTTPRPTAPPPQTSTADITSGIGNFFTNLLSEYVSGATVEYQRRRKRNKRAALRFGDDDEEEKSKAEPSAERQSKPLKFVDDDDQPEVYDEMLADEDFHDEEDNEDTQLDKQIRFLSDAAPEDNAAKTAHGIRFTDDELDEHQQQQAGETNDAFQFPDVSARILNKPDAILAEEQQQFFPMDISEGERKLRVLVAAFNRLQAGRKLRFPTGTDERLYVEAENAGEQKKPPRTGKTLRLSEVESNSLEQQHQPSTQLVFKDSDDNDSLSGNLHYLYVQPSGKIKFPDQLSTHIRKGRILNRPTYASGYEQYIGADKAQRVVFESQSDQHRQPHYQSHTATPAVLVSNNYNSLIQQQQLQQQHIQTNTLHNYYPSQPSYTPASNQPNYANAYQQHYSGASVATAATQSQQRPYRKYEDDKNVYVTNGQGITEYYITPDGRKIYIR